MGTGWSISNKIDETIAIDWQFSNQSQHEIVINRIAIDWTNTLNEVHLRSRRSTWLGWVNRYIAHLLSTYLGTSNAY
jgi:hypothetical protein